MSNQSNFILQQGSRPRARRRSCGCHMSALRQGLRLKHTKGAQPRGKCHGAGGGRRTVPKDGLEDRQHGGGTHPAGFPTAARCRGTGAAVRNAEERRAKKAGSSSEQLSEVGDTGWTPGAGVEGGRLRRAEGRGGMRGMREVKRRERGGPRPRG